MDNLLLREDDNVCLLLGVLSILDEKTTVHHNIDLEIESIFLDKVDYEFYTKKLYQSYVDMHISMLQYKKLYENMEVCNNTLKDRLNELELSYKLAVQSSKPTTSRFVVCEDYDEDQFYKM